MDHCALISTGGEEMFVCREDQVTTPQYLHCPDPAQPAACYCSQSCHLPDKSWQTVLCPLCPRTTTWEPFNQSVTFLRDTAAPLSKHPQHWLGERGKSPVLIISPRLNLVPLVDCANFSQSLPESGYVLSLPGRYSQ